MAEGSHHNVEEAWLPEGEVPSPSTVQPASDFVQMRTALRTLNRGDLGTVSLDLANMVACGRECCSLASGKVSQMRKKMALCERL